MTASSGDQAVEMLQDITEPDLLLTDAVMPGRCQGKDVAQAFKNLWPERPVVMMSGYVDWRDFSETEKSALDYFMHKPFRLSEIVNVMEQNLRDSEKTTSIKRAVGS